MANNSGSVDIIKNKILAEANKYREDVCAQANAEAQKITEGYKAKAQDAHDRILSLAKANADGVVSAAQSSQSMRARNSLLSVKVELIEKAYLRATELIGALSKDEYIALFAAYLSKAAENAKLYEGKPVLTMGAKSPVSGEELIAACGDLSSEISIGEKSGNFDYGFCLAIGDITLDCSANTLVNGIRSTTETGVASILFAGV